VNTSVLGAIRPEWRFFAGGMIGSVLLAISSTLLPPLVVQPLFDKILQQGQYTQLPQSLLLTALILLVSSAGLYLQDMYFGVGAAKFGARMRQGVFQTLLRSQVQRGKISAERASQAALDVRELELFYATELTAIVGQGLVMLAVGVALLRLNAFLTFGFVLILIPLVLASGWLAHRLEAALAKAQIESSIASSLLSEALSKLEVVKAFRAEQKLEQSFLRVNSRATQAMRRRSSLGSLNAPIAQITGGVAIVTLLALGVTEVQTGRMTTASLTTFITQLALGIAPIQIFARSYGRLAAIRAPIKNLSAVLETKPEFETGSDQHTPSGMLTLNNLSASYENQVVLENISFQIPKGSFTAIIGASGSGKTTLIRTLLRLLEPSQGRLSLGQQDMQLFTRAAWRSAFAYVPQNPSLFAGTIRENLTLARNATDDELMMVLQQVGLHQEISSLDTVLGENGTGLSGGQQQRLAIARAFINKAEILIFDEPTSSLDPISEQQIKVLLESLRGAKTLIVIAHRLSTIEQADQVLKFDAGRLVWTGLAKEIQGLES
jgi:ABC-type multidrug transport system fused ATPase/permease subunit